MKVITCPPFCLRHLFVDEDDHLFTFLSKTFLCRRRRLRRLFVDEDDHLPILSETVVHFSGRHDGAGTVLPSPGVIPDTVGHRASWISGDPRGTQMDGMPENQRRKSTLILFGGNSPKVSLDEELQLLLSAYPPAFLQHCPRPRTTACLFRAPEPQRACSLGNHCETSSNSSIILPRCVLQSLLFTTIPYCQVKSATKPVQSHGEPAL
ncbi:hypothetical protein AAMO2058_001270200 [Amorphochlora amoebiformis]